MVEWISTQERLPEKTGKLSYEYVWCLIYVNGEVKMHPWNCEHLVWDDIHMDDFCYNPKEPTHWMLLPEAPNSGNTCPEKSDGY